MMPKLPTVFEASPEEMRAYQDLLDRRDALAAKQPLAFALRARPAQLEPELGGPWRSAWYVRGARGSGKTWTGAGQLALEITQNEPLPNDEVSEYGIVAPTIGDTRDTCLEGPSGLLQALGAKVSRGVLIDRGPWVAGYNRSMSQVYLRNGGTVFGASAEDGGFRVQGRNLRVCWADEIGLWARWETAWDESIRYALRKDPAKLIATATPKMNQKSRVLIKRLLDDPNVAKSFLPLEANVEHLNADRVAELMRLRGTRLGRQEVGGELVLDIEGAYFFQTQIDDDRIYPEGRRPRRNLPAWLEQVIGGFGLTRMVVAVDPAVTTDEDSDETGIVVAGLGENGHGYVVEDLSGRYSPDEWARISIDAYRRWQADVIVGEVNNGGDMVGSTIHTVDADAPYRPIRATRGKILRAEPISAAYTQHRVHHVGDPEHFAALESQLIDCVPGQDQEHDDRLDACVYALTELGLAGGGMTWMQAYGVDEIPVLHVVPDLEDDEESDDPDYDPWANVYKNEPHIFGG